MTDDTTDARIYGGADPENRTPPPPEGVRGEGADQDVMATRRAMVAGGATVDIQDTSGIAVAEAGKHSGLKRDGDG